MNCEHHYEEIYRINIGEGVERVIKWCHKCGTVETHELINGQRYHEKKFIPDSQK